MSVATCERANTIEAGVLDKWFSVLSDYKEERLRMSEETQQEQERSYTVMVVGDGGSSVERVMVSEISMERFKELNELAVAAGTSHTMSGSGLSEEIAKLGVLEAPPAGVSPKETMRAFVRGKSGHRFGMRK